LKQSCKTGAVLLGVLLFPALSQARDFGVFVPAIHAGKLTSSVLYEHLKVDEDFNTRGKADFTSQVVGPQFTYGITDQIAVAVKGGVLVDPEEDVQGSQWKGHSGYLYGLDLYNEVFPATGVRPGVQASIGASGFSVPFNRLVDSSGVTTLIDQHMTGIDYHASVLLSMKWKMLQPYGGVRLFGRSVNWRDNQPASGQPGTIVGHAHGNASLVLGLPVRLTKDLQFQFEAILINQTALTAGLTLAAF